jgi:zinc protease
MLRTTIASLLLLLATTAHAQAPKPPELALEAYRLPNGLKVALHRDASVPRVTVCMAYHVGSRNELAGRTGFAHFFEHMMFRGTKNVPNYDIPLQETGAQSNAFTSEDMTVYFETVASNYLERAIYLEAERLAFLPTALDQKKFDTEREVVKNERRQSIENVPYGLSEEIMLANVFPKGHPYSWTVIGSMKDLSAATLDDLKRFFAEFYHPANATLCLSGDFDVARAKTLIEKYMSPLVGGPVPVKMTLPLSPAVARKIVSTDEVQLPRTYWTWPTVADDHADAPALEVLATILAGGDTSRLYKKLVLEKRLSKDVGADSGTKEVSGTFTIQSTAAEGKSLADVESIIAAEIERLRAEPPSAAEMRRVLARFEYGAFRGLTAPLGRAIVLATGFAQHDDPNYYRRDFARHFDVKPADVQRVARQYLPTSKVVLWIEPAKPDQPKSDAVQAGPLPSNAPAPSLVTRTPAAGPDWSKMPGPAPLVPFKAPRITRGTLGNGLDVWIVPWRTLPITSAQLLLPGGTADDPPGKSGLATLTAKLFDQGTKDMTSTEYAEALQELGGTLAVGNDDDQTSVMFGGLARNFDAKLTLLGKVLTSPRFDPADVDRERQQQLADLLQGPDNPSWIAGRVFPMLLFGKDHPYANPDQGYAQTVRGLTSDDAREFHRTWFAPKGATLLVVGDVDPTALMTSLEKNLGSWTGGNASTKPRPPAETPTDPGVCYFVDKPGAVQSVLSVGRRWVDRADPRYFATLIGNRVLGADFLSRLNQNLREDKGYSYGAGSSFKFRRTGGTWQASTSVRADATAPALKEVLSELDALPSTRPLTNEEIGLAREAEARSYPETFESPSGIVGALEEMAVFHLPGDYLDTYLSNLQNLKLDEIAKAMAAVVDPKSRAILVVGDRKSVEPKLKALGFKEIRVITPDGKPVTK